MSNTYEERDRAEALETYEWDDVWFEQAPNGDKPRALLIGDSISRGCRLKVIENVRAWGYADNYATSKALDNPCFQPMLSMVLAQQPRCEVIHFNNGLHGWHLDDMAYQTHYESAIRFLMEKAPNAKLIIGLTTPVREKENLEQVSERNERVLRRNEVAEAVCSKFGLMLNDLYTPVSNRPELYSQDGVHFTDEGYRLLAKQIADKIQR